MFPMAGVGHKEHRDDGNTRAPTGTREQRWLELPTPVYKATAKLKTGPANHGIVEIGKALTAHRVQLSPALPRPAVTMSPNAISTWPQTQPRNADLVIKEGSLISKIHFDCGTSNKLIFKNPFCPFPAG